MKARSFLFSEVITSLESFLISKPKTLQNYVTFCIEEISHQRLPLLAPDLRDAQFSGAARRFFHNPCRPPGFTTRASVLRGRQRGNTALSSWKDCPRDDAMMTRPTQEITLYKLLDSLGQRCPEDPGSCVPTSSP